MPHLENRATPPSRVTAREICGGNRPQAGRLAAVAGAEIALLAVIVAAFWSQDWRYSLPTPPPATLSQPSIGQTPAWPAAMRQKLTRRTDRAVLLHFFNPDCPCSRFNLDHVRELVRRFGSKVSFVAVLQGEDAASAARSFAAKHLDIESVCDPDGSIAAAAGVFSTPQAVLLDRDGKLYFRGNYNISRYCTDTRTQFARLAMEALLEGRPSFAAPAAARIAYGCPLPGDR